MAQFPRTDINFEPLALGANTFGWTSDEETSFAVLDAFVDAGGSLVDTADGYSHWVPGNVGGESETIIGRWIASRGKRDSLLVATKVSTNPQFAGLAPSNIAAAADASLQRLGTDHIDLYYAHFDDDTQPISAIATAFDDLVKAGKVRHVAISNFSVDRIREWFDFVDQEGLARPVAFQPQYNLLHRGDVENGYGPLALEKEVALFPYFSLAAGFLTGKYRTPDDLLGQSRSAALQSYLGDDAKQVAAFNVVSILRDIAAEHGVEVSSVALAWLLSKEPVTAPIASARTTDQLPALLAAIGLELTPGQIAALDSASASFI